jgi:hypothetical protein
VVENVNLMYLIQYGASGVVSCPCGPYSASTVEVPETVPEKRGTLQQKLQTKIGALRICDERLWF